MSFIREYFRGVLWPRQKTTQGDKTNYRYIIVGMLVTDKPLNLDEFINETVIDGEVFGLTNVIEGAKKREPKITIGDATDVLLNLEKI